ncbi:MAG: DMT family transporter [Chlamydiales bacterium]|nr:DMT family transporter [Chlamydiales bacterium]
MNKDLFQPLDESHLHEAHHFRKGVILMLIFGLFSTCIVALARKLQESTEIPTIMLFQNLVGLLFTLPSVIKHHFKDVRRAPFRLLLIRCIFGQLNTVMVLMAIRSISLANTVLLNNTAPIFVPLVAYFWLKKKIEKKIWIGIFLGFLGVMLILKPTSEVFNYGATYALIGGVFLAVVMITIRLLSSKEKSRVVMFYFFLTGVLLALPFSIATWTALSAQTLILLIGLGLITIIAQSIFMLAFRYGSATQLSPFTYTAVVYSALFDWFFWDKIPTYLSIIGMILVAAGGIYAIFYTRPIKPAKPT